MFTMREEELYDLDPYKRIFTEIGIDVAFRSPTDVMLNNSILDATKPVREFLKRNDLHDFENQERGGDKYKKVLTAFFITKDGPIETIASLYRARRRGDRRINITDLKYHCKPDDLLALFTDGKSIYIINLSLPEIQVSLLQDEYVNKFLKDLSEEEFKRGCDLTPKKFIQKLDSKYSHTPEFGLRVVNAIKRPSALSNKIKEINDYTCMICGDPGFEKKNGGKYAEVHHMIELNKQAPQSLQSWNVIVVCPTCHKKLHYGNVKSEFLNPGWKINIDGKEITLD